MGVAPNNQQIVPEPFRESRLIAYYDLEAGPNARFDKARVFEDNSATVDLCTLDEGEQIHEMDAINLYQESDRLGQCGR